MSGWSLLGILRHSVQLLTLPCVMTLKYRVHLLLFSGVLVLLLTGDPTDSFITLGLTRLYILH